MLLCWGFNCVHPWCLTQTSSFVSSLIPIKNLPKPIQWHYNTGHTQRAAANGDVMDLVMICIHTPMMASLCGLVVRENKSELQKLIYFRRLVCQWYELLLIMYIDFIPHLAHNGPWWTVGGFWLITAHIFRMQMGEIFQLIISFSYIFSRLFVIVLEMSSYTGGGHNSWYPCQSLFVYSGWHGRMLPGPEYTSYQLLTEWLQTQGCHERLQHDRNVLPCHIHVC